MDKIYIIHYSKLINRRKYLLKEIITQKIEKKYNIEWVEKYNQEDIIKNYNELINNYDDVEIDNVEIIQITEFGNYINFKKKISISEYSLFLKYKYCFQDALKENYDNILILEDDNIIPKDFDEYIKKIISLNKSQICVISNHHNIIRNEFEVYESDLFKTRGTGAILYKKDAINIINKKLLPTISIDFKINEIITKEKISVSWVFPGLKDRNLSSSINK